MRSHHLIDENDDVYIARLRSIRVMDKTVSRCLGFVQFAQLYTFSPHSGGGFTKHKTKGPVYLVESIPDGAKVPAYKLILFDNATSQPVIKILTRASAVEHKKDQFYYLQSVDGLIALFIPYLDELYQLVYTCRHVITALSINPPDPKVIVPLVDGLFAPPKTTVAGSSATSSSTTSSSTTSSASTSSSQEQDAVSLRQFSIESLYQTIDALTMLSLDSKPAIADPITAVVNQLHELIPTVALSGAMWRKPANVGHLRIPTTTRAVCPAPRQQTMEKPPAQPASTPAAKKKESKLKKKQQQQLLQQQQQQQQQNASLSKLPHQDTPSLHMIDSGSTRSSASTPLLTGLSVGTSRAIPQQHHHQQQQQPPPPVPQPFKATDPLNLYLQELSSPTPVDVSTMFPPASIHPPQLPLTQPASSYHQDYHQPSSVPSSSLAGVPSAASTSTSAPHSQPALAAYMASLFGPSQATMTPVQPPSTPVQPPPPSSTPGQSTDLTTRPPSSGTPSRGISLNQVLSSPSSPHAQQTLGSTLLSLDHVFSSTGISISTSPRRPFLVGFSSDESSDDVDEMTTAQNADDMPSNHVALHQTQQPHQHHLQSQPQQQQQQQQHPNGISLTNDLLHVQPALDPRQLSEFEPPRPFALTHLETILCKNPVHFTTIRDFVDIYFQDSRQDLTPDECLWLTSVLGGKWDKFPLSKRAHLYVEALFKTGVDNFFNLYEYIRQAVEEGGGDGNGNGDGNASAHHHPSTQTDTPTKASTHVDGDHRAATPAVATTAASGTGVLHALQAQDDVHDVHDDNVHSAGQDGDEVVSADENATTEDDVDDGDDDDAAAVVLTHDDLVHQSRTTIVDDYDKTEPVDENTVDHELSLLLASLSTDN